jgi:hypothetical protein
MPTLPRPLAINDYIANAESLNSCMYCSISASFSVSSTGNVSHPTAAKTSSNIMQCDFCHALFCKDCVHKIINYVTSCKVISSSVKDSDGTFHPLQEIQSPFSAWKHNNCIKTILYLPG